MKAPKEKEDRFYKLLRSAYREREAGELDEGWIREVMAKVRNLPSPSPWRPYPEGMDRWFWKMVPAAALLLLITLAVLVRFEPVRDTEVLALLAYETESVTLARFPEP